MNIRDQTGSSAEFLGMLGGVSERFLKMHTTLTERFSINPKFGMDCRQLADGPRVDWFLELPLASLNILVWSLDLTYLSEKRAWVVGSSVEAIRANGDGAESVIDLPEYEIEADDDLPEAMEKAMADLDATIGQIDAREF